MNVKEHMCFPLFLPPCVSYKKFLVSSFLAPSVKSQEKGLPKSTYLSTYATLVTVVTVVIVVTVVTVMTVVTK